MRKVAEAYRKKIKIAIAPVLSKKIDSRKAPVIKKEIKQRVCALVSDKQSCGGATGDGTDPRLKIKGASFNNHIELQADLCRSGAGPQGITIKNGNGAELKFYQNEKGTICQKIIVTDLEVQKFDDLVYEKLDTGLKDECPDYVTCGDKIYNLLEGRLKELEKTGQSKRAGLCKYENLCPEKMATASCMPQLSAWFHPECRGVTPFVMVSF